MSFRNKLLVFFFFVCVHSGWGQVAAMEVYRAIVGDTISNTEKASQVEQFFQNKDTITKTALAEIYFEFSRWNWTDLRSKQDAITYGKKAHHLFLMEDERRSSLIERNLFNLGLFYRKLDVPDYTNALYYFDTLIAISGSSDNRIGKTYKEKGDIYEELGDFQRALENYENSKRILSKNNSYELLLKTNINILATYAALQDSLYLNDFESSFHQVLDIGKKIEITSIQKAKLYLSAGVMYNTIYDYRQSLPFYQKALKLAKFEEENEIIFLCLNDIGIYYKKEKKYKKSEELHRESAKYIAKNDLYSQSFIFNNLADLNLFQHDYINALNNYNEAIGKLIPSFRISSHENLPTLSDIDDSPYTKDILGYLIDKTNGWLAYYKATNDKNHLAQAAKTMELVDQVIDMLYFESREELSKLFWRKKGADLYLKAVSICYLLDQPERALYYMEKNKGLVLLENITTANARQTGGIPANVVDAEYAQMSRIKELENILSRGSSYTTYQKDSLKERVFNQKNAYQQFIDSLETEFPKYHRFKKGLEIVSAADLQKDLSKNEFVVSYILGKTEGYVLLLSEEDTEVKKLTNFEKLQKEIDLYRALVSRPFVTEQERVKFHQVARSLYSQLLPFEALENTSEEIKLNIVPDGILQSIPFEALVTTDKTSLSEAYLINNCSIHYNYSLSVNKETTNFDSQNATGFTGFVPGQFKDDYLPSLLYGEVETKTLTPYFEDNWFIGSRATKAEFLREYDTQNIVHISTHGGVDGESPWLAFYDEKLTLDELYFLKNQKELVVLSACRTSLGEHKQGEGTFNLTRGFINSGARSVIATLWDVNEKSSADIISKFYENAMDGHTKSDALRNAKLSYLTDNANTSLASPYYWSALVVTGDNSTLDASSDIWKFLLFGALLLGIALLVRRFR